MGQDLSTLSPEELKKRQIREMDMEIKHKLGKGANYNMKIVIKGERNTGKTCLFNRLQRKAFIEDHITTEEIQTATIPWDYKVSNDRIKVEVWDVVDHGKKKTTQKKSDGLKIAIEESGEAYIEEDDEPVPESLPTPNQKVEAGNHSLENIRLDAETINVYKDANAVLFTMDPRKKWTFEYVERELANVPKGVFVLLLANYRDCPQNQRVVSEYEIQEFAASSGKYVRAIECSMKNCYGMKGIRCFFNLPFLKIKRAYIMAQLKENEADLDAADQEFTFVNKEQHYEFYLKWLAENRQNRKAREHAESSLPSGPPLRIPEGARGKHTGESVPNGDAASAEQSKSVPASPLESVKKLLRVESAPASPASAESQAPREAKPPTRRPTDPNPPQQAKPKPSPQKPPQAPQTPQKPATPASAPATPKTPEAKTPAAKPAPPQASPQTPSGGGISSWTKWFTGKSQTAAPKPPPVDVEKELSKVVEQAAKNPAVRGKSTIDDFAPITDTTDADFWAVGDSDDEDGQEKDDDDDDADNGRSFAIAKDEEPDFDEEPEEEEAKPAPKSAPAPKPAPKPAPAVVSKEVQKTAPVQAKPTTYHKPAPVEESDEDEGNGYEGFSDSSDDEKQPTTPKKEKQQLAPVTAVPTEAPEKISRSWGGDRNESGSFGLAQQQRGRNSQSYGNLPSVEQQQPTPVPQSPRKEEPAKKEKSKPKYVVLQNEDLPSLDTPQGETKSNDNNGQLNGGGGDYEAFGGDPKAEDKERRREERRKQRHRDKEREGSDKGERRKHRHREKDREGSDRGERRKHRHRSKNEEKEPRSPANGEYSGF